MRVQYVARLCQLSDFKRECAYPNLKTTHTSCMLKTDKLAWPFSTYHGIPSPSLPLLPEQRSDGRMQRTFKGAGRCPRTNQRVGEGLPACRPGP
ncbi:hypothetical protein VTK56DRAFT_209 [Thermocarpiscus australiensis]